MLATKGWTLGSFFFPFTGARGGNGVTGIYEVEDLGYYWTSAPDGYNTSSGTVNEWAVYAKNMLLSNDYIRARNDQDRAACYAVRAVREQ